MFKMLNMTNMIILIIAVTALIISIICMNKKCDNFGDYACKKVTGDGGRGFGKAEEGQSCNTADKISGLYTCKSAEICKKGLTCINNKCQKGEDKKICANSTKEGGTGEVPFCQSDGPTPSSDCDPIKFVCNTLDCPRCKNFPGCKVRNIPGIPKPICGNPNVPIDPKKDGSYDKLCTSNGINCNPNDKTEKNICN